jgi:hypothetical protein
VVRHHRTTRPQQNGKGIGTETNFMKTILRFGAVFFSITASALAQSPMIFTQPQSQAAQVGTNVTFSVTVGNFGVLPATSSGTLSLWLKADAGVITNGSGQVSQWQDQSANGNHASQPTTSLQPFLVSPSSLGGRPAIRFNGAQNGNGGDYLHGAADVGLADAFTSFAVYQTTNNNNSEMVVFDVGVPGTVGGVRGFCLVTQAMMFTSWARDYYPGYLIAPNSFHICTDRFNTNKSSIEMFDTTATSTTNFAPISTGGQNNPGAGYYVGGVDGTASGVGYNRTLAGDIAEILIYRGMLSETDRLAVEQYLKQKYLVPSSSGPYTYQWQVNGTPITWGTDSALVVTNAQVADAGSYRVLVSNASGTTTSSDAILQVGTAPSIITAPTSQTVAQGNTLSASVSASGSAPLAYSWRQNGTVLAEATNSSLTIANAQPTNSGSYSVVVSNPFGSITSSPVVLQVVAVPVISRQPQSQSVVAGTNATFSVTIDPMVPTTSSGTLSLWLKADTGVITNASGQVSQWQDQSANANHASQTTTALQPTLAFPSSLGGRAVVHFNGAQNNTTGQYLRGTGDVSLTNAFTSFAVYQFTNNNNSQMVLFDVGVPGTVGGVRGFCLVTQAMMFTAWAADYYPGYLPVPNTFHIGTDRLNTNKTSIELFDTTATASTNFAPISTGGMINPGAGYYIGGVDGTRSGVDFNRTLAGDIAEILIYRGALSETDRLAVEQYLKQKYLVASSSGPYTYQWQMNGTPISWGTDSTLTITNAQASDAGNYRVIVSNSAGATTSSDATLQIGTAPSITSAPTSQTIAQGSTLSVSVSASGSAPLAYTWLQNGKALVQATNSSLTIPNAQPVNSGSYSVVVSNAFGSVTSTPVTLQVDATPAISRQPQSQSVNPGSSATFNVMVDPIAPAITSGALRLWLKADAGVLTNATGLVSVWQDQSGNNNHASQSVAGQQPALVFPSAIGGRPALRFDGIENSTTGDYLRGTGDVAIPNAYTAFAVYSESLNTDPNGVGKEIVFVGTASPGAGRGIAVTPANTLLFTTFAVDYNTGFAIPTNTYRIATERFDTNKTLAEIWDRSPTNSTRYSFAASGQTIPPAGYYVAGMGSNMRNFGGDVAEVLIYSGYLPDSDRLAVEQYLAAKYYQSVSSAGFTYQWQLNGVNISGATNSSLTIASAQTTNAGTYNVVVCNGSACVTSANATLALTPPSIISQPLNQTVLTGSNATFTVGLASGGSPVLPTATSGTLRLWLRADAGVVTNASGAVTQWQDQSGNGNHAAQGSASLQPALVYPASLPGRPAVRFNGAVHKTDGQYLRGTGDVSVPDAMTAFAVYQTLTTDSAENIVYYVGVPGNYGAGRTLNIPAQQIYFGTWTYDYPSGFFITSNAFRICTDRFNTNQSTIEQFDITATTNRSVAKATSGQSAPAAGYYIGGIDGTLPNVNSDRTLSGDVAEMLIYRGYLTDADRSAVEQYLQQKYLAPSAQTATYQWRLNGTNIDGATNAALTLANAQAALAGSYSVVVCNDGGCVTSSEATLAVVQLPGINSQPQSQTVAQGATATFSVDATGTAPLQYQWTKNGATIADATTSVLTLTNAQGPNIGSYTVVVANPYGTVTSSAATLSIQGIPDSLWSGLVAYYPFSGNAQDASGNGNNGSPTNVVYGLDRNGQAGAAADFSSGNAYVDVPTLNSMTYHPVTYSAWFKLNDYSAASERRSSDGYFVMTLIGRDLSGNQSEGSLCLYNPPTPYTGPNTTFLYYSGATGVWGPYPDTNKWAHVSFTIDAENNATFYINGKMTSSVVFNAAQNALIPFRIGASASFADYRLGWKGLIDDVRVYNRALSSNEVSQLFYSEAPVSLLVPSIDAQPQSATRVVASNAVFSVSASGAQPLAYQWLFNGSPVLDATNTSYTVTNPQLTDDGSSYSVVITNSYGTVTSAAAALTVGLAPSISAQPSSQTVAEGGSAVFTANVTGTAPLVYQWLFNGSAISGATNSALTLTSAKLSDAGSYAFTVANTFGVAASSSATLRVDALPQIGAQPQNQSVIAGNSATFSVSVTNLGTPVLPAVGSGTLRLWLRADAGVVTNASGAVSQWQDQSGNSNDATQSTTNLQPAFVYPALLSGRPAVRFNGVTHKDDGQYLHGTGDVSVPDAMTSFSVYQTLTNDDSQNVVCFVGVPGNYGASRAVYLSQQQVLFGTWTYDYSSGFIANSNEFRICTDRFDTNRSTIEISDITATTNRSMSAATSGQSAPAPGYYVGGIDGSLPFVVSDRTLGGDVAEVLIYRGYLSDTDRSAVEQYLKQKYLTPSVLAVTYQWRLNGNVIAGATNSTLTITNAQASNGGTYDVVVCNGSACVTSTPATLMVNYPPSITSNPVSQSVIVGNPVTFTANASGTASLSYRWQHNGANISGATTTALSLASAQLSDAGSYTFIATSPYGSATSSAATLQVITSTLIADNVSGAGVSTIVEPISLLALGNENALGFSLSFDPAVLSLTSVSLGSNASGATLFYNTNNQSSGQVGIVISLPTGSTFAAGTQQVALVTFKSALVASGAVSAVNFTDVPTTRQIADDLANSLAATYVNGSVSVSATVLEGDVSPRPNGNQNVTITDWVQVGRFVAGLDTPSSGSEFQRADCAPRNTLGNGQLSVSDWVQAGRYAVGLDPLTAAGGPTGPTAHIAFHPNSPSPRTITLNSVATSGVTNVVSVQLNAQGNESAVGFSLSFDNQLLEFVGASVGSGASGASMNVNSLQASNGSVGIALAMPIGQSFAAGAQECVRLSFVPTLYSSGTSNLAFTDAPVIREVSDVSANAVTATYVDSSLAVSGLVPPLLTVGTDGSGNVTLTWPVTTGFGLESVSNLSTNWTPVAVAPVTNGSNATVTQPVSGDQMYFRLRKP